MSDLIKDDFLGSSLTSQWTPVTANGGTIVVSGGSVTLAITSTAGSLAKITQTTPPGLADGDAFEFIVSAASNFDVILLCRDNASTTAFQVGVGVTGGAWRTYLHRETTGGTPETAGPTIASAPRARLLRSGTNLLAQTWNGSAWVTWDTMNASSFGALWTPAFASARAEILVSDKNTAGPASIVVSQVGTPTPIVANAAQLIAASVPDPIITGTPYTIQAEAIDTLNANIRDTSFTDPITLGVDTALPTGFGITGGTLTQNAVAGVATFPGIIFGAALLPPTLDPFIDTTARKIIWTTVPTTIADRTLIPSAIVGRVATLLDVTDAAFVTPVRLKLRVGNGEMSGTNIVTPVAGVFTFLANTVAVALEANQNGGIITLGIHDYQGQSNLITVTGLTVLAASVVIQQEIVPRSSFIEPIAVINVQTVAGGSVLIKGTVDGVNFFLIDANAYVGGGAVNTIAAAGSFFGKVNVNGLRAIRLEKSVVGVTVASATLIVTGV
jgi:hypothetical protein